MQYLLAGISRVHFGEARLISQDGVLMQVEFFTQRRLAFWDECAVESPLSLEAKKHLAARIREEFSRLAYGRLVIVIKGGHVVQFERTERERFTGLDGEGI